MNAMPFGSNLAKIIHSFLLFLKFWKMTINKESRIDLGRSGFPAAQGFRFRSRFLDLDMTNWRFLNFWWLWWLILITIGDLIFMSQKSPKYVIWPKKLVKYVELLWRLWACEHICFHIHNPKMCIFLVLFHF